MYWCWLSYQTILRTSDFEIVAGCPEHKNQCPLLQPSSANCKCERVQKYHKVNSAQKTVAAVMNPKLTKSTHKNDFTQALCLPQQPGTEVCVQEEWHHSDNSSGTLPQLPKFGTYRLSWIRVCVFNLFPLICPTILAQFLLALLQSTTIGLLSYCCYRRQRGKAAFPWLHPHWAEK